MSADPGADPPTGDADWASAPSDGAGAGPSHLVRMAPAQILDRLDRADPSWLEVVRMYATNHAIGGELGLDRPTRLAWAEVARRAIELVRRTDLDDFGGRLLVEHEMRLRAGLIRAFGADRERDLFDPDVVADWFVSCVQGETVESARADSVRLRRITGRPPEPDELRRMRALRCIKNALAPVDLLASSPGGLDGLVDADRASLLASWLDARSSLV